MLEKILGFILLVATIFPLSWQIVIETLKD
jgi:hypothetical protein